MPPQQHLLLRPLPAGTGFCFCVLPDKGQGVMRTVLMVTALALAFQPNSKSLQIDTESASFMLPGCRAFIAGSKDDPFSQGRCLGIVETLATATLVQGRDLCSPSPPAIVTNGEAIKAVVRYLDSRSQRLHENFFWLAIEALEDAWPCKNPPSL